MLWKPFSCKHEIRHFVVNIFLIDVQTLFPQFYVLDI